MLVLKRWYEYVTRRTLFQVHALRVFDNAYDFHFPFRVCRIPAANVTTYRTLVMKEKVRKSLVDDGDFGRAKLVAIVEFSTSNERNTHCGEKPWKNTIYIRVEVFALLGRIPFGT